VAAPPGKSSEQDEQDVVARRALLGLGLVGLASLVASACGGTAFNSSSSNMRKKGDKAQSGGSTPGGVDDPWTDAANQCKLAAADPTNKAAVDACNAAKQKAIDVCNAAAADPSNQDAAASCDAAKKAGLIGDKTDASGPSLGNGSDQDSCFANTVTAVDVDQTPKADGDLIPKVKFYGRTDSALIAIKFDSAQPIEQVLLATPSGKLLGLHGITGADKSADGKFRPIVFDNIWLKDGGKDITEVRILVQMGKAVKVHAEPLAFFTTYNSKPVIDLSNRSDMTAMYANQSVTRFSENGGSFAVDRTVVYPYNAAYGGRDVSAAAGDDHRYLHTIQSSSTLTPQLGADAIKGTITDIMGDPIDLTGGGIIEHQLFCTYVDAGASVVRTVLHIG